MDTRLGELVRLAGQQPTSGSVRDLCSKEQGREWSSWTPDFLLWLWACSMWEHRPFHRLEGCLSYTVRSRPTREAKQSSILKQYRREDRKARLEDRTRQNTRAKWGEDMTCWKDGTGVLQVMQGLREKRKLCVGNECISVYCRDKRIDCAGF